MPLRDSTKHENDAGVHVGQDGILSYTTTGRPVRIKDENGVAQDAILRRRLFSEEPMQVTICGGGNAAHVLVSLVGSQPGWTVNVYAPYGDEARRWRRSITLQGGVTATTSSGAVTGRPSLISDDPADVVPGSQIVLLAVPAFAHEALLQDIVPHLMEGTWVGALPARGGFDWCVRKRLDERVEQAVVFGLQTLPWACRIETYGQEVVILGAKAQVDLAAQPASRAGEVAALLSRLLQVSLQPISGFLSLTLANTGQLIHPGVMYGLFRDWDGRPYDEAPLFYQGIDASIAGILQRLSDEVQALRAALERRYPHLDLSAVRSLEEWLRRSYGATITDPSSLQSCLVTNRSYAGLRAPMRPIDGGLVPDFGARYLAEDVPYGLVVTRGIAELAGVATPMMDRVINWAQERLGRQYLINGRLRGRDLPISRAPQRYGFHNLDSLIRTT